MELVLPKIGLASTEKIDLIYDYLSCFSVGFVETSSVSDDASLSFSFMSTVPVEFLPKSHIEYIASISWQIEGCGCEVTSVTCDYTIKNRVHWFGCWELKIFLNLEGRGQCCSSTDQYVFFLYFYLFFHHKVNIYFLNFFKKNFF